MARWFYAVVALSCAIVLGCGGKDAAPTATSQPTQTPSPTATATPEPSATPRPRPSASAFPSGLKAEADDLLRQIVQLRGTPLQRPVDMFLLTRDQAREFYAAGNEQAAAPPAGTAPAGTAGPAPIDSKQAVYELLGMAPKPDSEDPGAPGSVQQQQLDNLVSILTGFYEPEFNAFYMIDTINGGIYGSLARSTIVHELTHALQYQEVDLQAMADARAGNADAMTALLSVMEGDAVNTEIQILGYSTRSTYREPVCFTIPAPMRPGTPYVVERELDVWYEDGLCFVQAIAAQEPGGVARIFDNMPATMEQILHPEKYLAGEEALPVALPALDAALGAGWSRAGSGVFGEFGLQNVLLPGLADDRPGVQAAAAGWGGDAWNLYASGDERLLHLETVWDSAGDATEFTDALRRSLANRGASITGPGPDSFSANLDGNTWTVWQHGAAVTLLAANDPAAAASAAVALGLP